MQGDFKVDERSNAEMQEESTKMNTKPKHQNADPPASQGCGGPNSEFLTMPTFRASSHSVHITFGYSSSSKGMRIRILALLCIYKYMTKAELE